MRVVCVEGRARVGLRTEASGSSLCFALLGSLENRDDVVDMGPAGSDVEPAENAGAGPEQVGGGRWAPDDRALGRVLVEQLGQRGALRRGHGVQFELAGVPHQAVNPVPADVGVVEPLGPGSRVRIVDCRSGGQLRVIEREVGQGGVA